MDAARPLEIEPLSNRLLIHRLSAALLPAAVRLRLHPNSVTIAGFGFGLLAALAYWQWTDWCFATLGLILMTCWLVMDGLDGQLARATGKSSDIGRLIDGVADYSTFIAVNLALLFSLPNPGQAAAMAVMAGLAHALQAQFYEGERATYIRRKAGRFEAVKRPQNGGFIERLHNRGEALLGNRTRPFDTLLAAATETERVRLLAAWQPRAAATLRHLSPISSNGRAVAIWLAAIAGHPALFWGWELFGLTLIALAGASRLRQAEPVPRCGKASEGPAQASGGTGAAHITGDFGA